MTSTQPSAGAVGTPDGIIHTEDLTKVYPGTDFVAVDKLSLAHLTLHWLLVLTFVPLACVAMAGLGLVLGTSFEPRNIGLMFGFIILPITFLGGTYYSWTRLAPVTVGGWHWLQTVVLINPLIYVNEGMRAAFTTAPHMHLYVIYPVVAAFGALFLAIGLRNFKRRVLS
jgi:ABC-2 type transport system permease protein